MVLWETIQAFVLAHPLGFHISVIGVCLILLAQASSLTVLGISNYAKKLGLSDYLIGLLVVALAASVPEFLASMSGVALESPDVVFGTIFGSNLIGISLILGIFAIYGKKIPVQEKMFNKTKWDIIVLTSLPFLLMFDGILGKIDGVILLAAFAAYAIVLWRREGEAGKMKKNVKFKSLYKDAALFISNLIIVLICSFFLVNSSLEIAEILALSPFLVTIVILGLGSQVPDLFLGLQAMKKGHDTVAVGDLIGSMITKSLLFLGIFGFSSLRFDRLNVLFLGVMTISTLILLFGFIKKGSLTRKDGIYLIGIYAIFMILQVTLF